METIGELIKPIDRGPSLVGGGQKKRAKKLQRKVTLPLYDLIREGTWLTKHPDALCAEQRLTPKDMWIFRHHATDTVHYGADRKRPLYVGVFRLREGAVKGYHYEEGEYYQPKDDHYEQMYAERPAAALRIDAPLTKEGDPYWVDIWYHKRGRPRGKTKTSSRGKRMVAISKLNKATRTTAFPALKDLQKTAVTCLQRCAITTAKKQNTAPAKKKKRKTPAADEEKKKPKKAAEPPKRKRQSEIPPVEAFLQANEEKEFSIEVVAALEEFTEHLRVHQRQKKRRKSKKVK